MFFGERDGMGGDNGGQQSQCFPVSSSGSVVLMVVLASDSRG